MFFLQILSDETKRREYDQWGTTSEQMGRQGQGGMGADFNSWNFESNINPEELFRKIFGEAGFGASAFGEKLRETDYTQNKQGFAAAEEVSCFTPSILFFCPVKSTPIHFY